MLGTHCDGQRLGEAERVFSREIEIEDRLSIAKAAGVEVALTRPSERRIQRVMDLIVEADSAKTRREVRVPSSNIAANAEGPGIVIEVCLDERKEADIRQRHKVRCGRRGVRCKHAEVAVGGRALLPPVRSADGVAMAVRTEGV